MITPKQITYTQIPSGSKIVKIVAPKAAPRTYINGKGQVRTTTTTSK